jgi:hypothetical protein
MSDEWACKYTTITSPELRGFLVSDTRVRLSLCFRSFGWNEGSLADKAALVSFKNLNVGTTTFIDLPPTEAADKSEERAVGLIHNFEVLGLETNSLIFNFVPGTRTYNTFVNGLKFDRVYAIPEETCAYDPKIATPVDPAHPRPGAASNLRSQLRLPLVDYVTAWLNSNSIITTQPFAAFVDAFEKNGESNGAKRLRIEKATAELCPKVIHVFGRLAFFCNADAASAVRPRSAPPGTKRQPEISVRGIVADCAATVNEGVVTIFGLLLWGLADHGYRPERVGWFVLVTIAGSFFYLWLVVRVMWVTPA